MQPTLYIHLGQHKTGTTSLQRFCTRNRAALARDFGLLYPAPCENSSEGPLHRHYSLFPFEQERWDKIRQQVEASGCKKVLLSNEDLSMRGIDDATFKAIGERFPGFAVVYIIYVRRIDDSCKAWYMQSVKRDNMVDVSYESYLAGQDKARSYRLFPSRLLERCERQVGRESLILRIYERERLLEGNIVDDIFSIFGIRLPDDLPRARQYNPGIPQEALPLLTDTLRKHAIRDPTRKEIYDKLIAAFRKAPDASIPDRLAAEVEAEIVRMDGFIPGFREFHEKSALDFSLAKADISPQELLIIDLLYSILFELRKGQTRRFRLLELGENHLLPLVKSFSAFIRRIPQGMGRLFSK